MTPTQEKGSEGRSPDGGPHVPALRGPPANLGWEPGMGAPGGGPQGWQGERRNDGFHTVASVLQFSCRSGMNQYVENEEKQKHWAIIIITTGKSGYQVGVYDT